MDKKKERGASLLRKGWKASNLCQALSICHAASYILNLYSIMDEETDAHEC